MQQPSSKLSEETAALQAALASVCRSGVITKIPGTTSDQRVGTYRTLIHGNFEDILARAYPIAREIVGLTRWDFLVDDFVAAVPATSPQLWRMPQEFMQFVVAGSYGKKFKLPYLDDLLRFEWIEIEVFMMENRNPSTVQPVISIEQDELILNLEFRKLTTTYPVFEKVDRDFERRRGRYDLVVFRNPHNLQAEYLLVAPLALALIECLATQPLKLTQALAWACKSLTVEITANLKSAAVPLVSELISRGMILGKV